MLLPPPDLPEPTRRELRASVGRPPCSSGSILAPHCRELLNPEAVRRLARDNTNDEWDLLLPQRDLFKRARDTLGEEDAGPDVQRWTVAWLSRAQQLRDERNKVVHSIVHYDGRPGWSGFYPRSRNMRRMETREWRAPTQVNKQSEGATRWTCN